jgi:hypothetical protein
MHAKIVAILLTALITGPLWAQQAVIDMHVHTGNAVQAGPDHADNLALRDAYLAEANENNVVLFAASGAHDFVQSWRTFFGERMLAGAPFPCINGRTQFEGQTDGRMPCYETGEAFPELGWLRNQYESGQLQLMGELGTQYAGLAFDDPKMLPYYQLAQELDIPVAIHVAGAPPRTAQGCCPEFRLSIGDPVLLEEILVRFPRLRLQIMHANVLTYPGLLRLLQQFPTVKVDLTPFQSILPRQGFHQMLRSYQMNGLTNRIMFATDDFPLASSLEAYRSADFLSKDELDGILCANAQEFLAMSGICGLQSNPDSGR